MSGKIIPNPVQTEKFRSKWSESHKFLIYLDRVSPSWYAIIIMRNTSYYVWWHHWTCDIFMKPFFIYIKIPVIKSYIWYILKTKMELWRIEKARILMLIYMRTTRVSVNFYQACSRDQVFRDVSEINRCSVQYQTSLRNFRENDLFKKKYYKINIDRFCIIKTINVCSQSSIHLTHNELLHKISIAFFMYIQLMYYVKWHHTYFFAKQSIPTTHTLTIHHYIYI